MWRTKRKLFLTKETAKSQGEVVLESCPQPPGTSHAIRDHFQGNSAPEALCTLITVVKACLESY